ncbi:MAG: cupin domain-containing protein [Saprospiraceae bacterium]|nr:cupin domain-containing protein [Saprospiraceae bacterium]
MKRKEFFSTAITTGLVTLGSPFFIRPSLQSKISKPKIVSNSEGKVTNVIGDIQTLKLSGADTGGEMTLIETENVPGTMIPMHVHSREDEIFKVLSGQLEMTVGGETKVLKAGDLAFAPKNIPHMWKVVGAEKCKTILTAFPAGIELMFSELGSLPSGPPDFEKVTEICGRFGVEFV